MLRRFLFSYLEATQRDKTLLQRHRRETASNLRTVLSHFTPWGGTAVTYLLGVPSASWYICVSLQRNVRVFKHVHAIFLGRLRFNDFSNNKVTGFAMMHVDNSIKIQSTELNMYDAQFFHRAVCDRNARIYLLSTSLRKRYATMT